MLVSLDEERFTRDDQATARFAGAEVAKPATSEGNSFRNTPSRNTNNLGWDNEGDRLPDRHRRLRPSSVRGSLHPEVAHLPAHDTGVRSQSALG